MYFILLQTSYWKNHINHQYKVNWYSWMDRFWFFLNNWPILVQLYAPLGHTFFVEIFGIFHFQIWDIQISQILEYSIFYGISRNIPKLIWDIHRLGKSGIWYFVWNIPNLIWDIHIVKKMEYGIFRYIPKFIWDILNCPQFGILE